MAFTRTLAVGHCLPIALVTLATVSASVRADDFDGYLKTLFAEKCVRCHGGKAVNGKVNLQQVASERQLLGKPELISDIIGVIDSNDMPPEGEPQISKPDRARLLTILRRMLRTAARAKGKRKPVAIRRLNRLQYNNTLKDLFGLKRDVFPVPEKLMTRAGDYVVSKSGKMPDRVTVASHSLAPKAGLRDVRAFPKDLRASHGFDNQANQLTLSPLLLDAFLRLSVSIVESPDFTRENVGMWDDFFAEPSGDADKELVIRQRLDRFLHRAFRGLADDVTRDRYAAYVTAKLKQGVPFTDCMKKAVSAALSSPLFLYRSTTVDDQDRQFELASRLSYFLWNSCPDDELLRLAKRGELAQPVTLNRTIDRMLADRKISRFLDAFPSQWMQLENLLAVTPDPKKSRYFQLDRKYPASLQMVLEPLLLFDAVFVEDRRLIELISPTFGFQSEFLKTWYTSDLTPPRVDVRRIVEEGRVNDIRRRKLQGSIKQTETERDKLLQSVRSKLLAARKKDPEAAKPVDLKPYAAWEFNGDLKESVRSLELEARGKVEFHDGMVVLNRSFLISKPLSIDLKAKSLEVWCQVSDLNQRGGGVMGIQGPGDFFDTIVLGERKPRHWISGSNGFSRTDDFAGSTPETKAGEMLHLAMVYTKDGTTTLYRDGKPYGKPFRKGAATFPRDRSSVIFGLRHLPPGGNRYLAVRIDKARLYDRDLTASEVAASAAGNGLYIAQKDVDAALTADQKARRNELAKSLTRHQAELKKVPPRRDPKKVQQATNRRYEDGIRRQLRSQVFDRVPADDPRYGGVITNAAVLSMTSGPRRTHPISRGAWIIEVIFNDPPPPPPNDVPPLKEEDDGKNLTPRQRFAAHRKNPSCAGCHSRLDPLGFALENFDITGRWRDKYENGLKVDASGALLRKHDFDGIVRFKSALVQEERRFAKAFVSHMLRFALARELSATDTITVDAIVEKTQQDHFKMKSVIRQVILSKDFVEGRN